jgi:hypothetical protein
MQGKIAAILFLISLSCISTINGTRNRKKCTKPVVAIHHTSDSQRFEAPIADDGICPPYRYCVSSCFSYLGNPKTNRLSQGAILATLGAGFWPTLATIDLFGVRNFSGLSYASKCRYILCETLTQTAWFGLLSYLLWQKWQA